MKAAPIATRKVTAPVTQVRPRPPRQAPMKNFPQRWMTMVKKNSSTLQRWMPLKNRPTLATCHHSGPFSPRIIPETTTTISEAIVAAPKT